MHLENGQFFDLTKTKEWNLFEDFCWSYSVDDSILHFATDYMGLSSGVEAILDYYDIADQFEDYVKENWEDYLEPNEDEDEE